MIIKNKDLLNKNYDIIYTDPPWNQTKGNKKNVDLIKIKNWIM